MLTKNLKRTLIKHLFAKYTLISVFSCLMLFVCGLLANTAETAQPQNQHTSSSASKQANSLVRITGVTASDADKEISKANAYTQDPTKPPNTVAAKRANEIEAKSDYVLTAIFTRNKQHYAVVNGNIVGEGDAVSDMIVSDISAHNISMFNKAASSKKIVLELNGASQVKTQVKK